MESVARLSESSFFDTAQDYPHHTNFFTASQPRLEYDIFGETLRRNFFLGGLPECICQS
jgi:hypothetical protein